MKIVYENQFSGKTYFYTIAPRLRLPLDDYDERQLQRLRPEQRPLGANHPRHAQAEAAELQRCVNVKRGESLTSIQRYPAIQVFRVVQLNFTPEIEVFYMLLDRSLTIFSTTSLKQHMEYFTFLC